MPFGISEGLNERLEPGKTDQVPLPITRAALFETLELTTAKVGSIEVAARKIKLASSDLNFLFLITTSNHILRGFRHSLLKQLVAEPKLSK